MKFKISIILALLVLGSVGLALSEDSLALPQEPKAPAPQENSGANTQWVWGEVVSVDALGKSLTLKYLDYEADQEKELIIVVDDSTSYQNLKSLDEIQPKDALSIDYILKDSRNIAKSISLEKSESAALGNKVDAGVVSQEIAQTNQ